MKTQPEEVIDRYNAAKLLRRFEITGVVLGALAFIVGTALTALAGPGEDDSVEQPHRSGGWDPHHQRATVRAVDPLRR